MRDVADKAFPQLPEATRERIGDMLDAAVAGARSAERERCTKIAYDAVLRFPGMKEHQARAIATAVAYFDE